MDGGLFVSSVGYSCFRCFRVAVLEAFPCIALWFPCSQALAVYGPQLGSDFGFDRCSTQCLGKRAEDLGCRVQMLGPRLALDVYNLCRGSELSTPTPRPHPAAKEDFCSSEASTSVCFIQARP